MVFKKITGGLNHSSGGFENSKRISARQLRAIWAMAARLGFSEEELHTRIELMTGKRSIRLLNKEEAQKIIRDLFVMGSGETIEDDQRSKEPIGGTEEQSAFIRILCRQIGWNLQQLEGLAKKMYGVRGLKEVDVKQASGLIEALKAIKGRHAA